MKLFIYCYGTTLSLVFEHTLKLLIGQTPQIVVRVCDLALKQVKS